MSTHPPSLHTFTLANGLRVYLQPDHRAPLVSVQLWYHVGASHEPQGQTGLSHLLEHLMFEGSSKLAPGEYTRLMTQLGAEPNAFTTLDATVYPLTLPVSHLEVALEAMADAMLSARFAAQPFERELQVVMAERRQNVDNHPFAQALESHTRLAHGDSPYANPVIGRLDDLQRMTPEATRAWHQIWYQPNNATLAVAGAIDEAQLHSLVSRHFGSLPAQLLPAAPAPREPNSLNRREQSIRSAGLRDGVLLSFNVPSLSTAAHADQAHALSLLPDLLTEGTSARLQARLLHQDQVLQTLASSYDPLFRGDTLFTLRAFTNAATTSPQTAASHLLNALRDLGQTPPTSKELARAKARLLARKTFARDDIDAQAQVIGRCAASGIDPASLALEQHRIEALTAEHLQDAAATWLTETRATVTCLFSQESSHA